MSSTKNKTPEKVGIRAIQDSIYNAHRSIVRFLQVFFSHRPVGDLRWIGDEYGVENSEESSILITGQRPDTIKAPHKRPLISVVRGQAMWANTSYNATREHQLSGEKVFTDMINTNMIVNCCAECSFRFLSPDGLTAIM